MFAMKVETLRYQLCIKREELIFDVGIQNIGSDNHENAGEN